ncbi:MAG: peroxiredoxin [Steroidobacter sp.]
MSKIAVGKTVPAFSLPGTNGKWKLSDAKGSHLVIYFYPRDNTAGCTTETAGFRDAYAQFRKADTGIVGISMDSMKSHEKFKEKLRLPFALLSDEEKTVCELFDVYKEKSMYGRKYMGIERSTFLIDSKGVLQQEWRKVKVPGHVAEVLAAARKL